MNLSDYLTLAKLRNADFARKIGVTAPCAHRYVHGKRIPEHEVMVRIVRATDGLVLPNDFYDIPPALLTRAQRSRRVAQAVAAASAGRGHKCSSHHSSSPPTMPDSG